MSNETNIIPLVDILSKQLRERVVMDGDDYVELETLNLVPQNEIDEAEIEQNRLMIEDQKDEVIKEAKANIAKTDTAVTVDMFQKLTTDEQDAITNYRDEQFKALQSGVLESDDENYNEHLKSVFKKFFIFK